MNAPHPDTETIRELMKGFSTSMLVTQGTDDRLHARPMTVAEVTDACDLWFITSGYSSAAWEVVCHREAHVICQKDYSAYLSIAGTATLVNDRARVEELWKEPFRVWFPGGKSDPDLVLISFRPQRAEFWDNTGFNKIAYLWEATRAYLSGETPRVKEGKQHGFVTLA